MKKKALISSILTIALCLSLIAGSTFALFTSESKVNVAVTSGKVNVVATATEPEIEWDARLNAETSQEMETNVSVNDNVVTLDKIIPGVTVKFYINVENKSDVTVLYRTIIKKVEDNGLWDGLEVRINEDLLSGDVLRSGWEKLTPEDTVEPIHVEIKFPYEKGNEYQAKSCKLAYTVEAVQGNAEMPSEWDGSVAQVPAESNGKITITNAAQFAGLMNATQDVNSAYAGKTIVLDCNIDFGGATINGVGSDQCNFAGTFDGQGHTVSNFVINNSRDMYAGLFNQVSSGGNVKNLNVENATVIGGKMVGVIASNAENGVVIENCHVANSIVISTIKKVGAVVGYTAGATVKDSSATNCIVYCADTDINESGKIIGYKNTGTNEGNNSDDNVTVYIGASYIANGVVLNGGIYEIFNADGMFWLAAKANENNGTYYTFTGKTAKLVADIDLNDQVWTPIGYNYYGGQFAGTFDGNGHTIKNLNVTADVTDDTGYYGTGLFGWNNGTVKNLTIDGAKVSGYGFVGAVAGYMERGTITDCTVKNADVTATHKSSNCCGDKAGAIVGYLNPGCTVTNNTAENCSITAARDAGQIIGCAYNSNVTIGNTANNVTVSANTTDCTDTDAGENINVAIIGRLIVQ